MTGSEIVILSPQGAAGLPDLLNALILAGLETKTMFPDQASFIGQVSAIPAQTSLCIIFADTFDFLNQMALFKNLLYRMKLLIIVPDESEKTIKAAHQLRPRLVRVADGNYPDISEIVSKMARNNLTESNSTVA